MEDFPLWGSPAGTLAYDDNLRRNLLASANYQHTNAQTDLLQNQLQNERAMGELMRRGMGPQGVTPGGSDDLGATASAPAPQPSLGSRFGRLAELAANAGLVKQADEFGKTSSLMLAREASIRSRNARAAELHLTNVKKEAELVGQLMGDVTDQDSWNLANAMFAFQTGEQSPYDGMTYDPQIVERIKNGAISASKKADLAIADQRRQDRNSYETERLTQQGQQQRVREAAQRVREEREARLAKTSGPNKPIVTPKAMTDQAKKMILRDYPEMKDSLEDAPEAVASEAARLMRQNVALDQNTALGQAFAAAVKSGDFQTSSGYAGTDYGKKTRFIGQGKTVETAMSLPTDKSRLVKGRFYTNAAGQAAQWDGAKFKLAGSAPALSSRNTPARPIAEPNDSEDDQDEDD